MNPLVSIIIPCYNASRWIGAAIESALGQTWQNIEIVVVDDGSTDDSRSRIEAFRSSGIKIIIQPNRGASAARNAAIAASTGEWLQFLDADDLLDREKVARQLVLAETVGDRFVLCGKWTRFVSAIGDMPAVDEPLSTDANPVSWLRVKFEQNRMMHPAAWLVPRNIANRAGPWNESLSLDDDGEYFTRIVLASDGVRCCYEANSYYRSEISGTLSGMKTERAFRSAFLSLELSTHRLLEIDSSSATRHACATALQRYIYEAYPRAAECRRRAAELVRRYGGSELEPDGGPRFQRVRRWIGWKLAKRLQLRATRSHS